MSIIGKTKNELLELEFRARAIKALLNKNEKIIKQSGQEQTESEVSDDKKEQKGPSEEEIKEMTELLKKADEKKGDDDNEDQEGEI